MTHVHDAVVLGAGPSGSIAAMEMARAGLDVVLLDKSRHPRHRLGESFMPRALQVLHELGLEERMRGLPHIHKGGGEFLLGHEREGYIARFERAWPLGELRAFNLERAPFDEMLCEAAREAGAGVRLDEGAVRIERLADGDVEVTTAAGSVRGKWLVDCTGPATVVGRHLGTRRVVKGMDRVAYYAIATGVARRAPPDDGLVVGIIHEDGWFWLIPLDAERTSIGVILDRDVAEKSGVKPHEVLAWAIERSPRMAERCRDAALPERNQVVANFTYTCEPWAGPGYFMVGDAAAFLDPIFSTGVTLGMESARHVASLIADCARGRTTPDQAREAYLKRVKGVTGIFFGLVSAFYGRSFRSLFLSPQNPLGVRRAILTLLAGHAFDVPFFVRWRLKLLYLFVWLNRFLPLVKRRKAVPLLGAAPVAEASRKDAPAAAPRSSAA